MLVSPSISQEILFGWQDLIRFGVISENFLNIKKNTETVRSISLHSAELKEHAEKLMEDFSDMFSDTLSTLTHILGEEMTIKLIKENEVCFKRGKVIGSASPMTDFNFITNSYMVNSVMATNQAHSCLLYTSPSPRDRG